MKNRGFTLIELLVVIAIIGLLSSVVLASLNSAREKANNATARTELREIVQAITIAQGESGTALRYITGNTCSDCSCRGIGSIKNIAETHQCYQVWESAIAAIESASDGVVSGISRALRDPWGSPYLLDENELEIGGDPCREDSLKSAGADGNFPSSDDIVVDVPFGSSNCLN